MPAPLMDFADSPVSLPTEEQGPWILVFLSVGCSGCKMQMPSFLRFVRASKIPADRVISVINGDRNGIEFYSDQLRAVSKLVPSGENTAPLEAELAVSSFPSYFIVSEGRVLFAAQSSARLLDEGLHLLEAPLEAAH
ncbi:hypothetical protein [Streptomyces dangxiongensis]|uniref:hypothetical protein n=1 Tax=Streptomyces dangxiongensis TaxID=1442032 RepID=UPI0013CEE1C8|nr:hypothetical protein [Streptomyces dangxiongensis]